MLSLFEMKKYYELNEDEICDVIAKKYGCRKTDVYIRKEKEYHGAGYTECIKATIKVERE